MKLPNRDGFPGRLVEKFIKYRVPRSAAALSYSLTLSLFPLLICLSVMLGSLDISMEDVYSMGRGLIPASALEFIESYFEYAASGNHRALFLAGAAMLLASSSAAFRSMENTMADIHGSVRSPKLLRLLLSFAFSILFLLSVYISVGVILSGKWVFTRLSEYFAVGLFAGVWHWLRFVILFVIMYFMILGIYAVTAPEGFKRVNRGAGAFFASAALVGVSVVFSGLIEMSTRYTLVYGSLASVIVLMIWLYLCGIVLIMGNAVNVVLAEIYKKKE